MLYTLFWGKGMGMGSEMGDMTSWRSSIMIEGGYSPKILGGIAP